jgi:hypothetical protein
MSFIPFFALSYTLFSMSFNPFFAISSWSKAFFAMAFFAAFAFAITLLPAFFAAKNE